MAIIEGPKDFLNLKKLKGVNDEYQRIKNAFRDASQRRLVSKWEDVKDKYEKYLKDDAYRK